MRVLSYLLEKVSCRQTDVSLCTNWFVEDVFIHLCRVSTVERRLERWNPCLQCCQSCVMIDEQGTEVKWLQK